jgi:hypothetical protein
LHAKGWSEREKEMYPKINPHDVEENQTL